MMVGEAERTALILDDNHFAMLSDAMDVFCPHEAMGAARVAEETGLHLLSDHCVGGYVRLGIQEWDDVPGMKSPDGYTPTGRLIWFEVNGNREVFAFRMVLGKGDMALRQDLFRRLGETAPAALRPTTQLGRTQNTLTVERQKIDPEADVETTANQLIAQAVSFAARWLPELDRFVRPGGTK